MIVALYVRSNPHKDWHFRIARVMPEDHSFETFKEYIIKIYGSRRIADNKVIPANSLSHLPDILENLNVN